MTPYEKVLTKFRIWVTISAGKKDCGHLMPIDERCRIPDGNSSIVRNQLNVGRVTRRIIGMPPVSVGKSGYEASLGVKLAKAHGACASDKSSNKFTL